MSLLGNQQHELVNVFDGATMITIRRRYEGYLNLARHGHPRETNTTKKRNQKMKNPILNRPGQGTK